MARVLLFVLSLSLVFAAKPIVLSPQNPSSFRKDIGVLWTQGAFCEPKSYIEIATEFQSQMQDLGYNVWVVISDFVFDTPDPLTFEWMYNDAVDAMKEAGYTGDDIFVAAHSLGGVMAQEWAQGHADKVKGLALMGSVLLRSKRDINKTGTTTYDFPVPTLTVGGTRDGLMRISRVAESYWHGVRNIDQSQMNMFPVVAVEGAAHHSFMSAPYPKFVLDKDLSSQMSQTAAHQEVTQRIAQFFHYCLTQTVAAVSDEAATSTLSILSPLLTSMELEGNYNTKPPCYDSPIVNPPQPDCISGSPWNSAHAQKIMAGDLNGVTVSEDNNFHRVYSVTPVHLPYYNNTCVYGDASCVLDSITVTQNDYLTLNEFDTGYISVAAWEMKTKLKSRQASQIAAGFKNPEFNVTDTPSICAEINDAAIKWAVENAGEIALANYQANGTHMVTGADLGPFNAGPLWIWHYMQYNMSEDKKTVTVLSPMMRTDVDYPIHAAAGFHYCKVLSPYKVMEWIYVDSQYAFNGFKPAETKEPIQETFLSK